MKTKILFFLLICLPVTDLFSQDIKLNAGVSLSSFKSKGGSFLNDPVTYPFVTVGADYLEHKYWYLSSEIGYMENGGVEKQLSFIDGASSSPQKMDLKEHWPTLHLNTTFRVKIPVKNSHFLVGAGPVLDIILGDKNPRNMLPGLKANRSSFGLKADVGYEFRVGKNVKLGLVYSYIHTLTPYADYIGKHLYNGTSAFSIMVGYRL